MYTLPVQQDRAHSAASASVRNLVPAAVACANVGTSGCIRATASP